MCLLAARVCIHMIGRFFILRDNAAPYRWSQTHSIDFLVLHSKASFQLFREFSHDLDDSACQTCLLLHVDCKSVSIATYARFNNYLAS